MSLQISKFAPTKGSWLDLPLSCKVDNHWLQSWSIGASGGQERRGWCKRQDKWQDKQEQHRMSEKGRALRTAAALLPPPHLLGLLWVRVSCTSRTTKLRAPRRLTP